MIWTFLDIYKFVVLIMQSQPASAKLQYSFVELIFWGVSKLSFCLGLLLIFFCIIAIFLSVQSSKFACLVGIYCLMSLLVFSIAPFCHEEQGSANQTTAPKCFVMSLCAANSGPLSVVMVFICSLYVLYMFFIGKEQSSHLHCKWLRFLTMW